MITCRELIDFLMSYLDNELSADERREFERHLEVCPPCRRYIATYSEAVRLGKVALRPSDEAPPADVPETLVKAILAARRKPA
jgi:anti-sigma factor RsiW